ncbi:MAG: SirB1 family protein [Chloroflexota bacterium]
MPPSQIDLTAVGLHIAAEEYPSLDVVRERGRVALLAERAADKLPIRSSVFDAVYAVNEVLFDEEGLCGNREDYYNPLNSFVPDVLNRRLGNPITLAILYMEVARRAGYRFHGIGLPGHFLVRAGDGPDAIYVDPFDRGGLISQRECIRIIHLRLGGSSEGGNVRDEDYELFLRPAGKRAIVRRTLTNLKAVYMERGDYPRALAAAERIRIVEPTLWHNLADMARIQTGLGRFSAAAETLSLYIRKAPRGYDLAQARAALKHLRRRAASRPGMGEDAPERVHRPQSILPWGDS